jgi:hypothetical protein
MKEKQLLSHIGFYFLNKNIIFLGEFGCLASNSASQIIIEGDIKALAYLKDLN